MGESLESLLPQIQSANAVGYKAALAIFVFGNDTQYFDEITSVLSKKFAGLFYFFIIIII